MTRHPGEGRAVLPEDLRDEMPVDERGRVDRPPRELRGEVFRRVPRRARAAARARASSAGSSSSSRPYVVFEDRVARLPRVGARAARRRRDARRAPAPLVARRREPRRDARVPRAHRRDVRDRRRAEVGRREEPRPDGSRGDVGDRVRPLPRAQPVDVEQARRLGAPSGSTTCTPRRSSRSGCRPLRELAGESEQAFALFNNNATAQDPRNPLAVVSQAATNAFELRSLLST